MTSLIQSTNDLISMHKNDMRSSLAMASMPCINSVTRSLDPVLSCSTTSSMWSCPSHACFFCAIFLPKKSRWSASSSHRSAASLSVPSARFSIPRSDNALSMLSCIAHIKSLSEQMLLDPIRWITSTLPAFFAVKNFSHKSLSSSNSSKYALTSSSEASSSDFTVNAACDLPVP